MSSGKVGVPWYSPSRSATSEIFGRGRSPFCDHPVVTKTRLKPCTTQPRLARDHSQHFGRFPGLSPHALLLHAPCAPVARPPARFYTHHCDHWVDRALWGAVSPRAPPLHAPRAPVARPPARFYTHHCDHWVVAIITPKKPLRLCASALNKPRAMPPPKKSA